MAENDKPKLDPVTENLLTQFAKQISAIIASIITGIGKGLRALFVAVITGSVFRPKSKKG